MMLRYVPLLARRGAEVILSVQAPLETLAAEVEGVSAVGPAGRTAAALRHAHSADVPAPGVRHAAGHGAGRALAAGAQGRAGAWTERLGAQRRPRIGLCWSGSPIQKDNRWRSLPLERLAPLFDLDADLFALQTEISPADRATLDAAPIRDLSRELATYADTAAVMELMDLTITVCTSAANLVGGLGRPAFVMLGAGGRLALGPGARPLALVPLRAAVPAGEDRGVGRGGGPREERRRGHAGQRRRIAFLDISPGAP